MKHWTQQLKHFATPHWLAIALLVFLAPSLFAQETTGGIQGTVKDPTGAVVPKAKVVVSSSALAGTKDVLSDSTGYYRFTNLPPGTYAIAVTAEGFKTTKRDGLVLQVGHLPNIDHGPSDRGCSHH
jgi:hypothetical protein